MNKLTGKKIRWMSLLRLFGIGLFVFLILRIDLTKVWMNLKKVDLLLFVLAILFQAVMLLIKGVRWHLLREGKFQTKVFLLDIGIFLESYAVGIVTPGRFGEFMKAGHEQSKVGKWSSFLKIIAERGFDLGIFIFIGGLASVIYFSIPISQVLKYCICIFGVLLIVFSFILLSGKKLKAHFKKITTEKKKLNKIATLDFNLNIAQVNRIFFLSILSNIATFISCYLLAVGVSLGSNFLYTSGGVAVAGLLNLLPITIMGLGTREVTLIYLFGEFDSSLVLAFSFLMFITLQVGGGIIAALFGQVFIHKYKIEGREYDKI